MAMTRARAVALLVGIFLLGAVSGGLATGAFVASRVRHGGPPAERVERFVVQRLARRLQLDDAQRRILEQAAARARSRIEAILDEAHQELSPSLRPEQQKELDKVREEARERLRTRRRP